jgi:hypothetical protein
MTKKRVKDLVDGVEAGDGVVQTRGQRAPFHRRLTLLTLLYLAFMTLLYLALTVLYVPLDGGPRRQRRGR